ncbi:MAG: ABC transporter permease [Oscillospiraceae bacterium]|nr:ABC transporter permease [Oscillospiraceae bacterium]
MFSSVSQAFQSILSHKMRSFLTMLGIIIGIAAIITIISTIKGTNEQIKENLIGAGNNVVTVRLYQNDMEYEVAYYGNPVGVLRAEKGDAEALTKLKGVKEVAFYCFREYAEQVFYRNTGFNGMVYGVDETYFKVNGYQIRQGRGFSELEYSSIHKNILLDAVAARSLFGSADPVGEIIEIMGEPFTVIGVLERKKSFEPVINSVEDYDLFATEENGTIYMPRNAWPVVYRFDEPLQVDVSAESTEDMTAAGKAVADYLNANLIAESVLRNGIAYRSNDLLERAEQLQAMSNSTNQQLIWIAGISLLVGGVGVMNIMLVSVTERTAEIGLRKAIGAKRRRILSQFLVEASVLTGVGGVLGAALGVGLSQFLAKLMQTPTAVSVPAIVAAVAFSVVIGLVFGLLPAIKASKLNPIEALRRD